MKFEIRSVNTVYEKGIMQRVQVIYTASNNSRTVNINGHFDLTAEEYEGNEAIETLEGMAKQHLMDEVNAE